MSHSDDITITCGTRIAVYDDMLSAPHIVDIPPTDIASYIEQIASKTYEFSQRKGGQIPYTVIREVVENFIHAQFKEPCVSILDNGNTIRFADQGPGIADKYRAQLPGFTSATSDMKKYIRGVGSGLPLAKEYLHFSQGHLDIEDNITAGTVITIAIDNKTSTQPIISQQTPVYTQQNHRSQKRLDDREIDVLFLADRLGLIGPTEIHTNLGISISTAYRLLKNLEDAGYLEITSNRKRILTNAGFKFVNE